MVFVWNEKIFEKRKLCLKTKTKELKTFLNRNFEIKEIEEKSFHEFYFKIKALDSKIPWFLLFLKKTWHRKIIFFIKTFSIQNGFSKNTKKKTFCIVKNIFERKEKKEKFFGKKKMPLGRLFRVLKGKLLLKTISFKKKGRLFELVRTHFGSLDQGMIGSKPNKPNTMNL